MAFNVQDFRSQMVGDGARPNLFEVTLPFPGFALSGNAYQKLTFMCKSAQLPGSTVNSIPINYFGRELKFAGNRTFPDWSITIINDEDFGIRNAFERWMAGINSHLPNLRTPLGLSSVQYQQDGTVKQFGKTGDIIKQYRFVGAFPTDVSPIEVDWGANDTIEEFTVTLAYQWWDSIDGLSGVI